MKNTTFPKKKPVEFPPPTSSQAEAVFSELQARMAVDFRPYKFPTIRRRVERRMSLLKVGGYDPYLAYLKRHPEEVKRLYHDVLIHVTNFFRDPEIFDVLAGKVFPALTKGRSDSVRVWVPGCCTGEEVYSIAIAFIEHVEKTRQTISIQLFGTDISEPALEKARSGVYPAAIAKDVPKGRLERFFTPAGDGYQIRKFVRDLCVFARQDLTKDPPFSKLDLISCRNVLIYFDQPLQQRILPVFHYALKPGGFLLLGKSEAVTGALFEPIDKRGNLYVRKPGPPRPPFKFDASA
ncbi:MAG TPA: protein-glutamate O-methyltransferase CheR, partial [Candidatus Eisenbacteria bacterium]|nr:protein-glutamate O-methyltransferase CheR [Candidatus Eisenbacteria bacterium]